MFINYEILKRLNDFELFKRYLSKEQKKDLSKSQLKSTMLTFEDAGKGFYESQTKKNNPEIKHGKCNYYCKSGNIENHIYIDNFLQLRRILATDGSIVVLKPGSKDAQLYSGCSFNIKFPENLVKDIKYDSADLTSFLNLLSQVKLTYYEGFLRKTDTGILEDGQGVLIKSNGNFYEG